jgi:hypothetical protein
VTLTRKDLRAVVADTTPLTEEQLTIARPAPQQQPHRVRPVTYTTPEGPTFIGSEPTAPFGEDPTDPTTQAQPRVQSTGMVGRLNHTQGQGAAG